MSEDKITTIKIHVSTREKLKALGRKGDTYDSILLELMEAKE